MNRYIYAHNWLRPNIAYEEFFPGKVLHKKKSSFIWRSYPPTITLLRNIGEVWYFFGQHEDERYAFDTTISISNMRIHYE